MQRQSILSSHLREVSRIFLMIISFIEVIQWYCLCYQLATNIQ